MADLAEALDAAFRARYGLREVKTPATERRGLLARMNQLEKQAAQKGDRPGQAATRAAAAAGIPARTWRAWRQGGRGPSPKNLSKLEGAYKRQITLPALRRALRKAGVPGDVIITVTGTITWNGYKNQTPYRSIHFGPGRMGAVMRATIRAWAHEGPQQAATVFQHGLSDANDVPPDEEGGPGIVIEPGDNGETVSIHFP